MNLFLDIETTGIPDKYMKWNEDYMFYPYVVTIAWKFQNKQNYHIVFQEGREIPKGATKVHGISTKMGNDLKKTTGPEIVYRDLITDALHAANIIGHNIYFDTSIVKANILRYYGPDSEEARDIEFAFSKEKRIDTMRGSMGLCRKWPTLTELYTLLFKKKFVAHNSLEDVLATEKCFVELRRRKIL